jgi:hypothetical protein
MPSSKHVNAVVVHTVLVPLPVRVRVYVVGAGPFGPTALHDTCTARSDAFAELVDWNVGA